MQSKIRCAALFALLALVPARLAWAGVIEFHATVDATNPGPDGFFRLLNGTGNATAITGFTSLQGVPPSDITFTLSNFQLTQFTATLTTIHEVFAGTPGNPASFDFFQSGSLIATSTKPEFQVFIDLTNMSGLPARATASLPLTGPAGSPFFQEVLAQTGGSGILHGLSEPFNPFPGTSPATFDLTGTFTTAVPEPATWALLTIGAIGLFRALLATASFRSRSAYMQKESARRNQLG